MGRLGMLVLASTLTTAAPAHAASFDCGKAASPFEKAVCADSALSKRDEVLAATYRADRALLSPAGQTALQQSQRSWLAYARMLCRPGLTPLDAPRWSNYGRTPGAPAALVASCLEQTYRERQDVLSKAVVRLAGRTFLQTAIYKVQPAKPIEGVPGPDAAHWVVTNLQIDAPRTPGERAWNVDVSDALTSIATHPGDEVQNDDSTDGDFTAKLVSASPDFIDYQLLSGVYGKGQAHGQYSSESRLFSFRRRRACSADDIFRADREWKAALTDQIFDRLPEEWRKPEYKDAVKASVEDARYWIILPKGIEIQFDPYSVAGYIPPESVLAPWSGLQPYLRRDLPFNMRDLQAVSP